MVPGSERCSSQPLSSAQSSAALRLLLVYGAGCIAQPGPVWAHVCSGAVSSGGKTLKGGGGKKKALAAFMRLENSCLAPWPPDTLRAPLLPGMFCDLASSASAFPSNWRENTDGCHFLLVKIFVGISRTCREDNNPLLPALTLWAFRKPRQGEESWKPHARDTAAVNCTVRERWQFCLRLGALETQLILMGVVGV